MTNEMIYTFFASMGAMFAIIGVGLNAHWQKEGDKDRAKYSKLLAIVGIILILLTGYEWYYGIDPLAI